MKNIPLRLLLVEDSSDDVDLFMQALKRSEAGLEVEVVHDGEEALHYLKRGNSFANPELPQLILLDLNLPKKHGCQVLREIKNDDRLRMVPVIVFTTSNAPADVTCAYELGAACYLIKPDSFNGLLEMIRNIGVFWSAVKLPPLDGN